MVNNTSFGTTKTFSRRNMRFYIFQNKKVRNFRNQKFNQNIHAWDFNNKTAKYWNLSLTKPCFAINARVQFLIHFRNRDQKRNSITWSINSRLDQNWDGMHMRRVAKNWTIAYYMFIEVYNITTLIDVQFI